MLVGLSGYEWVSATCALLPRDATQIFRRSLRCHVPVRVLMGAKLVPLFLAIFSAARVHNRDQAYVVLCQLGALRLGIAEHDPEEESHLSLLALAFPGDLLFSWTPRQVIFANTIIALLFDQRNQCLGSRLAMLEENFLRLWRVVYPFSGIS